MIEVEGLTKSYQKGGGVTRVLQDVTFRVAPGEYVALMGPSGSGKSTLLNILGFLDRPDGGSYRFQDEDLSAADDDRLSAVRNRSIGFVFQQFHLLERATALQNVTLPLLYAEGEVGDVEARGQGALEAVGLGHRLHHFPGEMSGGEQQRVAVARALINDPSVVLADEPTGNLDAASGAEVLELFAALHRAGRTLVMITHDRAVAGHAGRVLALADGRVLADATSPPPSQARGAYPPPP